ncbi:MAG: hypothetical protein RBS73_11570 [Prolixibacteraceae bacterium]|jgi:hypothetical protein|nr:hypothetical protein [Prolixibacteraceae bacterium]
MNYRLLFILAFFCISSKGQSQSNSEKTDKVFFQKAIPVWVDSRNVKKDTGKTYSLTTSGRHDTRQAEQNLTVSFRAKIKVGNPADVLFKLTASSDYRAFVNGKFLGHGPCVAGHGYYRVDEYNLKDLLQPGENIIAVEVAGYNVYNYYLLNQPAFLQAEVTENGRVVVATGTQGGGVLFEAAMLDQRVKDVPLYSFQRPHIESYILTPDYNKWMVSAGDKLFHPLQLERTSHKNLIERRVKYPDYSIRKHTAVTGDSIYQFECNSTGFIGAKVKVNSPAKIIFSWDEILNDKGDVNARRLNSESFLYYQLQPGEYTLESFEPYTLQYLKVQIDEGDCVVSEPYIRQYVNSDVSRASFWCNDEKLNLIFKAAVETYKQNALDIFMDCPQRERAGWLCDSYFTARVAFNLSGNTLIETNFLENFLLPEKFEFLPKGMLPMCYPSDHPNANYIPNWAMWYVLELEEYFKRSGDHAMVMASRQRVMDLLDYFIPYENEDGLLEKLEKWVFVEWSKANSFVQDVNYPTNMVYAKMLEVTARLYHLPELRTKAEKIRKTIREQAFDGTFFIDNAIRVNGNLVPQKENRTETCQYYAFFFGTATPEMYPGLWNILVKDFGPRRKETKAYEEIYPSNAFIGNYLRLEVLSQNGQVKQLSHESVDNFAYMAELTGTLWENIHTRASLNHGFASHIAHVFYRDLLGLKEVDCVNKKLFITFNDTDIRSCKGAMPVDEELVALQWEKKGSKLLYRYSAPSGYEVFVKNNTSLKLEMLK